MGHWVNLMRIAGKQSYTRLRPLLVSAGLLLFAFAILMIGIDAMHMRPDEELTFRNMSLSFVDSMQQLATRNNQAPLWWIQIWAWQRTAGLSEFAGRVNSILWSMLTLAIVYQLGYSWFRERRFGWFAIALLSVNSYWFIYALEIRMYALGMLLVALSMRLFQTWLHKQTWQSAVMYGLSAALLLYTHYYFAFIVIAQVIYFLVFHLRKWYDIQHGIVVSVTALLTWLPGFIILIGQLAFISFADSGGLNIPTKPTNLRTILELANLSTNGLLWLYVILAMMGAIFLWRKRVFWLAIVWLIVSPMLVLHINLEATIYNVRYTSFFIPAIGLTIGISLAAIPLRRLSNRFGEALHTIILIAVCGVSLYNLSEYIPVRVPYRHIFADVSLNYEAGDVLFALPTYEDIYLEDQYQRYLPADLVNNRVYSVDEATTHRRIWFTTPLFLEDDTRAIFNTLETTHRVYDVAEHSECSREYCYIAQLMLAPPNEDATYFGDTIGFLGADVGTITDNQLPVLLWWEVETTPAADYSISLQLLREDGSLVTQVDRQIDPPEEDIGEIPTSQMQPDGNYIDWRVLELPFDLANGDYQLQVVVYQWWDGVRLTTDNNDDAIHIETIQINR